MTGRVKDKIEDLLQSKDKNIKQKDDKKNKKEDKRKKKKAKDEQNEIFFFQFLRLKYHELPKPNFITICPLVSKFKYADRWTYICDQHA
jgi:hypothetical protein